MRDDYGRIESRVALARGLCTYKEVVGKSRRTVLVHDGLWNARRV
jgi:hypothetical protein